MSMTSKKEMKQQFQDLLQFTDKEEKYDHDAQMLMFKFLGEVDQKMEQEGVTKKQLAEQIGTSPAYITQLFRGDKKLNFKTLAKLQDVLNMQFAVSTEEKQQNRKSDSKADDHGFWFFRPTKKTYDPKQVERNYPDAVVKELAA